MTAMAFLSCREATARQVSIAPPADNRAHWYVTVLKYMESNCLSRSTSMSGVISDHFVSFVRTQLITQHTRGASHKIEMLFIMN